MFTKMTKKPKTKTHIAIYNNNIHKRAIRVRNKNNKTPIYCFKYEILTRSIAIIKSASRLLVFECILIVQFDAVSCNTYTAVSASHCRGYPSVGIRNRGEFIYRVSIYQGPGRVAMSGFHEVALTMAVVAAVVSGSNHRVACLDAPVDVAAYSLNGQNIEWPCASTKRVYADTGRYVAKNVIVTRAQVWGDRAFVLTPRFRSGVPFTVSTVRLECEHRCWPVLVPYPCWELHDEDDPNAIQNAVDVYLDPMGVLWVLDSGVVNTMEQPVRKTQPRIFGIDVKTDKVVKQIDLSGLVCSASRLNYITADYGDDGRVFVYVSDAATRAVIVWEVAADRGYRVVLPKAITHDCTGRRDVLYIALARGPTAGGGTLYLTYLTSNRMYKIDACNLRQGCSEGTVVDLGPKPDKMVVLGTDGRTTVYFRYRGQGDVYAWDTDRPDEGRSFGSDRLVLVRKADDCGRLATHVAPDNRGGVLWILESNFPDYISGAVGCLGTDVRLQPLIAPCGKQCR